MIDQTALAGYRRALARRGRYVVVRRLSGDAPNLARFDAVVEAIVVNYTDTGDVMSVKPGGGITQGYRQVIVMAEDLAAVRWPLPVAKNDKVVLLGEQAAAPDQAQVSLPDGRTVYEIESLNVIAVDPYKRDIAGAVELHAEGV